MHASVRADARMYLHVCLRSHVHAVVCVSEQVRARMCAAVGEYAHVLGYACVRVWMRVHTHTSVLQILLLLRKPKSKGGIKSVSARCMCQPKHATWHVAATYIKRDYERRMFRPKSECTLSRHEYCALGYHSDYSFNYLLVN